MESTEGRARARVFARGGGGDGIFAGLTNNKQNRQKLTVTLLCRGGDVDPMRGNFLKERLSSVCLN